ncbi:hypothetical protein BHE74_00025390 [Ensete ventricosum]|nr:hypothetical protein GW17_00002101 [Ensete ventricosum]RWW67181.1 hypothetical protein BHE74_00025390 [Ensete ventricosum]
MTNGTHQAGHRIWHTAHVTSLPSQNGSFQYARKRIPRRRMRLGAGTNPLLSINSSAVYVHAVLPSRPHITIPTPIPLIDEELLSLSPPTLACRTCRVGIRKRPNPSSFPSSSISRPPPPPPPPPVPSLLPDPSSYVHPTAGKDGTPDNSGGGHGGRGGDRLHSDGDLNIDPIESGDPPHPDQPHGSSGIAAAGKVRLLDHLHNLPCSSSASIRCFVSLLWRDPLLVLEVLRRDVKEEDGMVDSNEGWNTHVNSNCSSSSAPVSAWEQLGDAATSQKKKRGRDGMDIEKKPKGKGRAKTSDTLANGSACTRVDGSDNGRCQGEDKEEGGGWMDGNGSNGKKRRSPAVLMEGSRCSRVNGRGWRCCQQTLVGYSLCEHHLGKGRLRSMASVRGQLGTSTGKLKRSSERTTALSKPLEDKQLQPDDADEIKMEDDKEKTAAPRRKKIGMVKARRISSLLDEINRPLPSLLSQPPEDAFMRMPDGSEAMV